MLNNICCIRPFGAVQESPEDGKCSRCARACLRCARRLLIWPLQSAETFSDALTEAYRLNAWHCVDTFVYFSHHLVTIPPPGWINAAHRNGVPVRNATRALS